MESLIDQNVPSRTAVTVQDLFNKIEADDCFEDVAETSLVSQILDDCKDNFDIEKNEAEEVLLPSYSKQFSALALCKWMCNVRVVSSNLRHYLSSLQRTVRLERSKATRQIIFDMALK